MTGGMAKYWIIPRVGDKVPALVTQLLVKWFQSNAGHQMWHIHLQHGHKHR